MADTNPIREKVEPFVREWLGEKYKKAFRRDSLPLSGCEGKHQFDAVSSDATVVACIRSASADTSGGNSPSGKLAGAYRDLYFLLLVNAQRRLLVLTDPDFHKYFIRGQKKNIPPSIEILHCELSQELKNLVLSVRKKATQEIDAGKPEYRKGAAGNG